MSIQARAYILLVTAAGAAAVAGAVLQFRASNPVLLLILGLLAVIGSGLKISLPRVTGTLSVSFLPIVLAAAFLEIPEVLLIAGAGAVAQTVFRASRLRLLQSAFNASSLIMSALAASLIGSLVADFIAARMILSGLAYYLVNAALVATVIALAEDRPLPEVWRSCFNETAVFFSAAILCATLAASGIPAGRTALRYPGLLFVPVVLLPWNVYRRRLARARLL